MSRLLICDKDNVTSTTNNKFTFTYNKEIENVKGISLKKCLLTAQKKYKMLYVRSNLASHLRNKTIAGSEAANRNSNIIGILTSDLSSSSVDIYNPNSYDLSLSANNASVILLKNANDENVYSGQIAYRVTDKGGLSGGTGDGNNVEVSFVSTDGLPWTINIVARSTGDGDLLIEDVDDINIYTLFEESGSGNNETITSVYDTITISHNPKADETGFDIIITESGCEVTDGKPYVYDAGSDTYTFSKITETHIVQYHEISSSLFNFSSFNENIRNIELSFYDSVTATTPVEVDHFCMVFNI